MSPGGADSVQLGGPIASPTVEELLAKPCPGGVDSVAFGKGFDESLPVTTLLSRFTPGGVDSIDFGKVDETASAVELLSRPAPGGKTTVVLGGDDAQWSTVSQAHGVGSAQACAAMEPQIRPAPGGADSINFAAEVNNPSVQALLARASPGGSDSVDFSTTPALQASAEELLTRPRPGGNVTVMLGSDGAQWIRDSQAVGVGSAEAVAALESTARPAPGGTDSVDFSSKPGHVSKEELLARPAVGGNTVVVLGGDQAAWTTDSSVIGVGSEEAVSHAGPRCNIPPGGVDSVNGISHAVASPSAEELLLRPATGGKTSIVLGGDALDWGTSSGTCEIPSGYVVEAVPRQAPGGVDSIDFAAAHATLPTADALLARPATGGVDSVDFGNANPSTLSSAELLMRPFPGGKDKVVLGSVNGDWSTSGQVHSQEAFDNAGNADTAVVRPPPGGVDSIVMAVSEEAPEVLLGRPPVGGSATVVLGGDNSKWSTCSDVIGNGCAEAASGSVVITAQTAIGAEDSVSFANDCAFTPAKPIRMMNGAAANLKTNLNLEDNSFTPTPGVSSNRFASGANQNAGNVLTDRPTTRVHQAPGGNSSIFLGDDRASPAVGVSEKRAVHIRQSPGGASSIFFGDEKFQHRGAQNENVNSTNLQKALQDVVKVTQAPGGNAAIVLG